MRTALLWVIPQRVVVISYRRFGTNYRSHFKGQKWLTQRRVVIAYRRFGTTYRSIQGSTGCTETSVMNCHYSLRESSEQRSSLLKLAVVQKINNLFILYGTRRFITGFTTAHWAKAQMRPQERGYTTQFECFYSQNLEVIIFVPGIEAYPIWRVNRILRIFSKQSIDKTQKP
jgi:hypothetical protein